MEDYEYASHLFIGTNVRLNPSGEIYKVVGVGGQFKGFSKSVILLNSKGKEKQISWNTIVTTVDDIK